MDRDSSHNDQLNTGLDQELAQLPIVDLTPFAKRAMRVRAQQHLAVVTAKPRWAARAETALLIALSTVHLGWALLHVCR